MQDVLTAGTALASEALAAPVDRRPLASVGDLLQFFPKRPGHGGHGAPVRSATAKFLAFIGSTAEETPIHLLETEQERYVEYLRDRLYKAETVRSYRHSINLLLKKARERGWETPPQVLPPHWSTVMALASEKEVQAIVRFAARIKKSPSTFDEDDLKAWVQESHALSTEVNIGLAPRCLRREHPRWLLTRWRCLLSCGTDRWYELIFDEVGGLSSTCLIGFLNP
jgi:hypothetical protein